MPPVRLVRQQAGFSVIEMMVVVGMLGIMSGFLAYGYKELDRPAENGALQTMGLIKKARAKALATTWAYKIQPNGGGTGITSSYAKNCSAATWTDDAKLRLTLPQGVHFNSTGWTICFTTRGLTDSSATINISDANGLTKTVSLAAGGGTKIQ